MTEDKEKIVVTPEHIQDKLNNLPKDDKEKIENALDKLAKGEIEGEPFKPVELKKKLRCMNCNSKNIYWFQDENSKEVHYFCEKCGESAWMYDWEYEQALERYPEMIIEND